MAIQEGDMAPAVKLETDSGKTVDLKSFRGKMVVLYFYPKADTPGCTQESCDFRDNLAKFKKKDVVVLGISPDKVSAQAKFRDKYDLTFPLLADVDHKVAEAFGVWKEKNRYGRKYMGVERTTIIIDPKGRIQKIYSKVKVDGHAEAVLGDV